MATKAQQEEQREALTQLRKIVKPGDELRTILRHVSSSGMSRSISVFKINGHGRVFDLTFLAANALGDKLDPHHDGIKIGGCGMDMGFEIVYRISYLLYGKGRGYACLGDGCPSNSHVNDRDAPRGRGVRHDDGYALSHRWM